MNIKSSLYILSYLATKTKWISDTSLLSEMNREYLSPIQYWDDFFNNYPFSMSASCICQDLQTIYCCSFIDEYERKFTPKRYPNEAEKIIRFKRIVLPAYKKIQSWKGLKNHRNYFLAHNYRINDKSVFDMEKKILLNVPTTNAEHILLADLVFLIAQNFIVVFPEIINSFELGKTLRDQLEYQSSKKENTLNELKKIEKEIEQNKIKT